jgi:hypothetical protein
LEEAIVTSSESTIGPSHGAVGQDPFWSGDIRRVLFGIEASPVYEINPPLISEIETAPKTTTYHFVLPPEMVHLANTTSVQTEVTTATLPPITTQRMPDVNLPPGYHELNALLHPTPPQTPAGSPVGCPALSPGTPLCSFKRACQDDLGGALHSGCWAFQGRENHCSTTKVFLLAEPSTGCREVHQVLHCLCHCQTDHQEAMPLYSASYPQSTLGIHLYALHVGPSFC